VLKNEIFVEVGEFFTIRTALKPLVFVEEKTN
jgi:hypothetical protein